MEYEDNCEESLPRKYPKNVYYQKGRPHQLKRYICKIYLEPYRRVGISISQ